MVKSSRERFKPFVEALSKRMTRLNFLEKFVMKNHCFKQKTETGYVGIFVVPNALGGGEYSVSLSTAISNTVVQSVLVKTELYDWDGSLTWSCGADLRTVRNEAGAIRHARSWTDREGRVFFDMEQLNRLSREQDVWIDLDPSTDDYERLANLAYGIIESWGWPLLHQYGFSDDALLEFCLRNDEYSKLFFLEPRKPITGMILARHLSRPDAVRVLIEQAKHDYGVFASLGNTDPIERFGRVAKALGFDIP